MLRLPPGMARPTIPPNPNPALQTQEMWEFAHLVMSLEPADFEFAGIYADKSGYHNTVTRNLARWPGTYSVKLSADLNGVRDKARALDIKSKQAASGAAPTIMAKYGARMRAAAKAHDPRVQHWREILGQFDVDETPEAIDFQSTAERQPDDTHEWHFHWSILALFVALAEAYEGMLSVLYGESPASWSAYARGGDDMTFVAKVPLKSGDLAVVVSTGVHCRWVGPDDWTAVVARYGDPVSTPLRSVGALVGPAPDGWVGAVDAAAVDKAAIAAAVAAAVGSLRVELADGDLAQIVGALAAAPDVPLDADDMPAMEQAIRNVLRGV